MQINVLTLFPNFFESPLQSSLLGKAVQKKLISIDCINIRDFSMNKHGKVDDAPYGGGQGMILMLEPIDRALESIKKKYSHSHSVLLTPRGHLLEQSKVISLASKKNLTLICGHYEGYDERITHYVDETIRVGNFILSGGEPAALLLIDSIARYQPGFMSNPKSLLEESFNQSGFFEHPQYTRPSVYKNDAVPDVLLSGNHEKINEWRAEQSAKDKNRFLV